MPNQNRVRVRTFDGRIVWRSMHRLLFGTRPVKRKRNNITEYRRKRKNARRIARRARRLNAHQRKSS